MQRRTVGLVLITLILAACGAPTPTPEPSPTAAPNVNVVNGIVYAEPRVSGVKAQTLDVYQPAQPGRWPVVVLAHGLSGSKEGYVKDSIAIAERGAVVVTPDWPAHLPDMAAREDGAGFREAYEVLACAIRFARTNAASYGAQPSPLIFVGHSYGARFGAWLALAGDSLEQMWLDYAAERGGPPSQVKCLAGEGSFEVDAFVGIAGDYTGFPRRLKEGNPELWSFLDPLAHVGRGPRLPVRWIHGERDATVDPETSIGMNDLLTEADYDTTLTLWDGKHRLPVDLTIDTIMDLAGQ